MEYTYLIIILITKFFQSFFNKKTSNIITGTTRYLSYGSYRYILSGTLAFFILIQGHWNKITLFEIGISALASAALILSMFCSLEAMKSGAMVLCTLAGGAGLLMPCIFGIFMFGENMSVWQFMGIGVMFVSAWLLVGYSKNLNGKFSFKTILLLIGTMVSNGTIMMAQKMYSLYVKDGNAALFSFLAFGIAGIFLLICYAGNLAVKREKPTCLSKPLLLYGIILSVSLLVINQLATIAAAVIPSAVLFSVNDGGGTIISAVVAAIFFGEKLTPRSVAGIILGIGSLIIINIL